MAIELRPSPAPARRPEDARHEGIDDERERCRPGVGRPTAPFAEPAERPTVAIIPVVASAPAPAAARALSSAAASGSPERSASASAARSRSERVEERLVAGPGVAQVRDRRLGRRGASGESRDVAVRTRSPRGPPALPRRPPAGPDRRSGRSPRHAGHPERRGADDRHRVVVAVASSWRRTPRAPIVIVTPWSPSPVGASSSPSASRARLDRVAGGQDAPPAGPRSSAEPGRAGRRVEEGPELVVETEDGDRRPGHLERRDVLADEAPADLAARRLESRRAAR